MPSASPAKKTTTTPTRAASAATPKTARPKPSPVEEAHDRIVRLDPALIVRDDYNARTTGTDPDDDLRASVAELGVQDPIHVRPLENGTYGAFKGWRRAQAQQTANATAEAEGRPTREIPAIIRAGPGRQRRDGAPAVSDRERSPRPDARPRPGQGHRDAGAH
ncbi:hypothetical protein GCM10010515_70820 [Streptomyces fructofermentans]|uniref:ParB-like N-terminal domain-containing protein n=1 Tax=Streptomyces fructofermentans TaxID=152141 RepID=A0A918NT13_9ACTN|nr:ParB N-terminal domain-containing protein [Streptomyces fructofermentans]GGX93832.1 hypothetical protein GCM10010515_70820 [Streptomyces fructofermentans]